jgi:hypothetical protein
MSGLLGLTRFAPPDIICRKLSAVDAYWGGMECVSEARKRVKKLYPPSFFARFFIPASLVNRLG